MGLRLVFAKGTETTRLFCGGCTTLDVVTAGAGGSVATVGWSAITEGDVVVRWGVVMLVTAGCGVGSVLAWKVK